MRFHKGICTVRGYILLMRKLKTTNCSLQKMSFLIGRCPLFLFHKVSFKGCPTFLAGNFADSNDDDGQSAFTKRVSVIIVLSTLFPTGEDTFYPLIVLQTLKQMCRVGLYQTSRPIQKSRRFSKSGPDPFIQESIVILMINIFAMY